MLSDAEFRFLLDYFNRPWQGYRKVRKGVKKRIRRHMQSLGCRDVQAYLTAISSDKSEEKIAKSCLLVTISRFFRDTRVWTCMEEIILPDLIRGFDGTINAWSAGCASGEEAYSLSILWHKSFAHAREGRRLNILATDVNPLNLERARAGRYGKSSLKEVDGPTLETYFKKVPGSRQYSVCSAVRFPVRWRIHDFFIPLSDGPFHIIMLRNNLLSYHKRAAAEKGFQTILDRLVPGGWLLTGAHEQLPCEWLSVFKRSQCSPLIYRYAP